MFYRLSRRHHVVVLTCILALAPIGVALARYTGVPFFAPAKQHTPSTRSADGNDGAIVGAGLPQYREHSGFDIRLPESTGPLVSLSAEALPPSFNSLAALDAVGATSASKNWGSSWSPEARGSALSRPRRGSASFATGGSGNSGVGAWGGVSGTAAPRQQPSQSRSEARATVAAAAPTPKPAASAPAPSRGSGGSSGGGSSSGGSSNSGSSSGGGSSSSGGGGGSVATAPVASGTAPVALVTAPPTVTTTTPGTAVVTVTTPPTTGTVGVAASPGAVSPASTPEPFSLLLVGTGLVGLYRSRRFFE
jgi:hypothetical protein